MPRLVPGLLVATLLLTALASSPSTAGEDPAPGSGGRAEVEARLASRDPCDLAWGAWLAGEQEVREAIPLLEAALRTAAGREGVDWRYVRRCALDALVRLDATGSNGTAVGARVQVRPELVSNASTSGR